MGDQSRIEHGPPPTPGIRNRPGARARIRARIRWVGVLAAATMLIGSACSGSSSNGGSPGGTGGLGADDLPPCPLDALTHATQPVEVTVWHTQTAKPGQTLKELVDQYNASQSKVKVTLENQGADYRELQKKFNSAVPSRQLPAIVGVDDTFTQSMGDSGVILPAQSCINADHYDMSPFAQTAKDYYTIHGVLWPASVNLGNALLFYNRDHFRRAGLDPDKPPTTLDEVRAYAEKIKAAGVVDKPVVHEFASWKTEFWLTGAGAGVVNNDNGRGSGRTDHATLADNAAAQRLFGWFKKMQDDGLLEAIAATPGQVNQYLAMAQQKASILVDTSSAATSIEAFLGGQKLDTGGAAGGDALNSINVSGLDFGAGPFPNLDAAGSGGSRDRATDPAAGATTGRTQVGGGAWYMTNTTPPEVQAGAWDFMKFMNTPEAQAKMFIGGSYLPYNTQAVNQPEMKDAFTKTMSGRWLKIAYDQVLAIDPRFPGPLIGPYDEFREAINSAQDQLMFNHAEPDAALGTAQSEVDQALTKYNREVGG